MVTVMLTSDSGPLLIHIGVAATRLGLSQYQVRRLVKTDVLPSTTIGNRVYIPETALDEYVGRIAEAVS